jgi:GTP pyrophosphokinase
MIERAKKRAKEWHDGQERLTGEPYHTHPFAVAELVKEFFDEIEAITAALLHDVVEDTEATVEDVERLFGPDVAFLVEGLSEDKSITDKAVRKATYHEQLETYGERDERIWYIKFCDIIHNIRTIDVKGEEKAQAYLDEVEEFYLPKAREIEGIIAERLGLWLQKKRSEISAEQ